MFSYPTPPPSANSDTSFTTTNTMTRFPDYVATITNQDSSANLPSYVAMATASSQHAPSPSSSSTSVSEEVQERGLKKKLVLMGVQYALDKYTKKNKKKKKSKLTLFRSIHGGQQEDGNEEEEEEDDDDDDEVEEAEIIDHGSSEANS